MAREGREVWAKRIERWRDSGLTLKEFASEIGVNANTLAGWRWRLGGEREAPPENVAAVARAPVFLELVSPPDDAAAQGAPVPVADPEPLEVVLRTGHRVRVPARFDGAALRRLIDVLEAH